MYLSCCRWEYIKMQSREDSLWESFPQAIQTCEGAGRYINAFQAPFQGLPPSESPGCVCPLSLLPPGNSPSHRECSSSGRFPDRSHRDQPVGLGCLGSRCGSRPSGAATRPEQFLGPPGGKLAPAAGGGNKSGVLLLLLQSGTTLYVCGSLSVSSPYVVEPDCRADSRIWSDHFLRWSDHSEYLLGGYV